MSQTTLYQSIISVAKKNETKPIFLPNTELYWESEAFRALRKGKYKLIQKKSLLTPSYIQLYDLESDPIEEVNIFDENIDQVKALVELANSKHQVFEEKPSPFDPKVEDSDQN